MKKGIAAVAMVAVGMVLALAVLPAFGFEFGFLDAFRMRATSYTVGEDFGEISVQSGGCDVSVYRSYDDTCQVYIRDRKDAARAARAENGVLTVSADRKARWYDPLTSLGDGDRYISIYLPADAYEALTVQTAGGDLYVEEELGFGSAELETAGGELSFYSQVGEDLTVSTESGDGYLNGVQAGGLTVRSGSGDLSLDTVTASGSMTVTAGSGDVFLWECDGAEVRIDTDSGDVSASFRSPKNFVTRTGSGSIDTPKSDKTAGTCAVTTGSGDIWLRISE